MTTAQPGSDEDTTTPASRDPAPDCSTHQPRSSSPRHRLVNSSSPHTEAGRAKTGPGRPPGSSDSGSLAGLEMTGGLQ